MTIRTGYMRLVGLVLVLAAIVDALALNWNRPSASACQAIAQIDTPPASCGPINYTLALVLACVGVGLIVVAGFIKGDDQK